MSAYSKAIGAFLTGLVQLIALFYPPVADFLGPEVLAAITMVISTGLVYWLTNTPKSS